MVTRESGHSYTLPATTETVHTGYYDNSLPPVLTIESGDVVSMETMTLMDGRLRPGISIEEIAASRIDYYARGLSSHSLTGPIFVQGAEPGDVLEIRILRLVPRTFGVNYTMPGFTGSGTLPEDFPEGYARTFIWDEGDQEITFSEGVQLPLRPFLGIMAVAPAEKGRVNAVPPGPHGGNIDLKELVEGTTLYLPVFVPGALFSTGDAHALQADGEVCTTAVETSMKEARLQFVVRKELKLERPMAETASHWITMGFHPDLDEAARMALRDAIDWLVQNRGFSRAEAYSLCSLAVDLRVTQLVDKHKGIHAMIPKSIFRSRAS